MEELNNLALAQEDDGKSIVRLYKNMKKDSEDRKNANYISSRLGQLEGYRAAIQARNEKMKKLCEDMPAYKEHDYFKTHYYEQLQKLYEETKALLDTYKINLAKKEEQPQQPENKDQQLRLKTQDVKIDQFIQTVNRIEDELTDNLTPAKAEIQLATVEKQWQSITALHEEIQIHEEKFCAPYFTSNLFFSTEAQYENIAAQLKMKIKMPMKQINQEPRSSHNVALPQIKIPFFDGKYEEWTTFADLFVRVIDENASLSNIEKMQYLKTHVRGEASRVIQHLQTTDVNYETAWNLLQKRYKNNRLVLAKLIDKMLDLPTVQWESAEKIKQLHDTTAECLEGINNLGIDTTSWGPIIGRIIVRKWDNETNKLYEQTLKNPHDMQDFEKLMEFLETRFHALETTTQAKKQFYSRKEETKNSKNEITCEQNCKFSHPLFSCPKFKAMTIFERNKLAREKKLCTNCLNHTNEEKCMSQNRCRVCNKPHHSLLHYEQTKSRSENSNKTATHLSLKNEGNPATKRSSVPVSSHVGIENQSVLITTALIHAITINGTRELLRVLVDPGSQASFITQQAAQILGQPTQKIHAEITGVGDDVPKIARGKMEIQITPRFPSNFIMKTSVLILPKLTQTLPQASFEADKSDWQNEFLADPTFNIAGPIDIILGAQEYGHILKDGLKKSTKTGLVAQNTELGWILSGNTTGASSPKKIQVQSLMTRIEEEEKITKFWELEEIESSRSITEDEEKCEEFYAKTSTRNEDGSYTVRIPFKEEHPELGESRPRAVSRFLQLEKRLTKNPKLKQEYSQFMDKYEKLGHMNKVPIADQRNGLYHIPHQAVIRESSTTTKLRVVFDASCKTSTGISLNEIMHVGPRLQQDLAQILLRWRTYKIVFSADIEKMYRQIKIHPEDRKYHRILWRKEADQPIQEFELATVTYGTSAAPFLAIRTLQQLAKDEEQEVPTAAKILLRDFYVDDLLSGANSIEEALTVQEDLLNLLRKGKFTLRKWASNEEKILINLPEELKDSSAVEISADNTRKSLGVHWAPKDDTFKFKISASDSTKNTKRWILSEISKIFDPLGWLAPVVIIAKLLIQELWMQNLLWDQPVPQATLKKWSTFQAELKSLEEIEIPRWIHHNPQKTKFELHGFCDASEKAYGAVIYARIINPATNEVTITLLTAKSKVAPIKTKTTLPRLELCAAVLLAKLMRKTVTTLGDNETTMHAWSDSMITLSWIKGNQQKWKTFVANRVAEIRKLTQPQIWGHVRTEDNPANAISRGVNPSKLKQFALWWNGPSWLPETTKWPRQEEIIEVDEEVKKPTIIAATIQVEDNDFIHRFSNLTKMLRVVSYCRRFIRNCRRTQEKTDGPLTAQEIEESTTQIIKYVQNTAYRTEMKTLQDKKQLEKVNKISNLTPFLDQNGSMRVGGRLENSSLPYNEKHPIILPPRHHFTKLVIEDAHKSTLHGGNQITLAYIRRKFWIVNGKKEVSSVIQKCVKCARFKAQVAQQQMGQLPAPRVAPSPPFSHTGVDYAGPILIRTTKGRGHKSCKGYIAIFVCFATKAIHLEAVSDMTTDSFLAAFKRFTARRGQCQHIYSDNGATFVGASKILEKEILSVTKDEQVQGHLANLGTQWHFIPPSAPHFGGLWEAGVKSMKFHLKRVIGEATLTFEELSTLIYQIEACLNSRPLTPLTNDVNDVQTLTPGHFLIGRELISPPDPISTPVNSSLSDRWRLIQKIKRDFWKIWSTEYLAKLQQRYKWKSQENNLKVGELVLIKEEVHPSRWPLARVIAIHPARDGTVRVATMRKDGGSIVKRAINNIIPLPVSGESEDTSNASIKVNATTTTTRIEPPRGENNQQKSTSKTAAPRNKFWSICVIILMMFITTKADEKYTIQHPPPGMYIEHIGQAIIERAIFRIKMQFEQSRLTQDVEAVSKTVAQMTELCKKAGTLTSDNPCSKLLHHLVQLETQAIRLKSGINSYVNERQRRGLLGTLLTSVFGVNDEVYKDIDDLDRNQQELIRASTHQTKLMLSTISTVNETETRITEKLQHFQDKLNEGIAVINKMDHWYMATDSNKIRIHILESYQIANNFIMEIIHHYTRVLKIQNHQANFHGLMTPHHINEIIAAASEKLPSNLAIFRHPLLNTKVHTDSEFIQVYGYFPIAEKSEFTLIKTTPVPLQILNNSYWILDIPTDLIAVDYNSQLYFQISDEELKMSHPLEEDKYLCSPSAVHSIENNKSCVIDEIYQKIDKKLCGVRKMKLTSIIWKELYTTNTWMFITLQPTKAALICNGIRQDITLNATGILRISQECIIKTQQNILTPKRTAKFRVIEGFTKHVPIQINTSISHLNLQPEEEPVIKVSEQFKDIKKKEEDIRDTLHDASWKKIRRHATVSNIVSGVTVLSILLVIWAVRQIWKKCRASKPTRSREGRSSPEAIELRPIFTQGVITSLKSEAARCSTSEQ